MKESDKQSVPKKYPKTFFNGCVLSFVMVGAFWVCVIGGTILLYRGCGHRNSKKPIVKTAQIQNNSLNTANVADYAQIRNQIQHKQSQVMSPRVQ